MGPEYRSFHSDLKALPLFWDFDRNSLAQQVFIDPVTGFTAPVTPSWQHDGYAGEADRLVKAHDRKYGLRAHARLAGKEALEAFEAANPPNLVVEVDRSRGDEPK